MHPKIKNFHRVAQNKTFQREKYLNLESFARQYKSALTKDAKVVKC